MVEEDEFRSTYHSINQRRCCFEKALLARGCSCSCSTRFYLADREGITCDSVPAHGRCARFLERLREKARFALAIRSPGDELPHAKEIRVQNGGLLGLQQLVHPDLPGNEVADVARLMVRAEQLWGNAEDFPYAELIKAIAGFEGRRKRGRR
ncbi:MAG TPA: hypothetical protein ENK05_11035 [Gammaproteobacteria bacterium]|nr:hypothetical protein [Gammaproteobacteria bacterium]